MNHLFMSKPYSPAVCVLRDCEWLRNILLLESTSKVRNKLHFVQNGCKSGTWMMITPLGSLFLSHLQLMRNVFNLPPKP